MVINSTCDLMAFLLLLQLVKQCWKKCSEVRNLYTFTNRWSRAL